MYFRYLVINFPWEREVPFIWTNLNPLDQRIPCAKFGWNWLSGSWEEVENRKSLQTDGQTEDGRQAIRKAHLSFQLRWAKKPIIYKIITKQFSMFMFFLIIFKNCLPLLSFSVGSGLKSFSVLQPEAHSKRKRDH